MAIAFVVAALEPYDADSYMGMHLTALVLCIVLIGFQLAYGPYQNVTDDYLALGTQCIIALALFYDLFRLIVRATCQEGVVTVAWRVWVEHALDPSSPPHHRRPL